MTTLPRGSILLVRNGTSSIAELILEAGRVASSAPEATVIGCAENIGRITRVEALVLQELGVAAVVTLPEEPSPTVILETAREATRSLEREIVPRLALLGRQVASILHPAIDVLMRGPLEWHVADWAAALGWTPKNLQRAFDRSGAPAPRYWVELRRGLGLIRTLQDACDDSVERALAEAGVTRSQTGRDLLKRVSGASPRQVRILRGWYWAIAHWQQWFWPMTKRKHCAPVEKVRDVTATAVHHNGSAAWPYRHVTSP